MGIYFHFFLGNYLGVELLGQVATLNLTFRGTATLFSTETTPFYIPIRRFPFLHTNTLKVSLQTFKSEFVTFSPLLYL